jgi:hypothetical protein
MYFVKLHYGLSFVPPDKVTDMFENTVLEYLNANKNKEDFSETAQEIEDLVAYF